VRLQDVPRRANDVVERGAIGGGHHTVLPA
jgi:hypothetical protein